MAIDRLINSTQGDSIISALGASGAIATALTTIATSANTPYNLENKLNAQYTTLTGYSKAQSASSISTSNDVTTALGKLEYKADKNISDISTLNTLTQGIDSSGDNFIEINGIKLFVSSTEPTSGMAEGDVGIGW